MKNPLKFIQEVKQETFRITWPTKKETMMGAVMVFALASIAAIFFLILDQILRFLLNLILTIIKGGFYPPFIFGRKMINKRINEVILY